MLRKTEKNQDPPTNKQENERTDSWLVGEMTNLELFPNEIIIGLAKSFIVSIGLTSQQFPVILKTFKLP